MKSRKRHLLKHNHDRHIRSNMRRPTKPKPRTKKTGQQKKKKKHPSNKIIPQLFSLRDSSQIRNKKIKKADHAHVDDQSDRTNQRHDSLSISNDSFIPVSNLPSEKEGHQYKKKTSTHAKKGS